MQVSNYFYRDTVEEQIYQGIGEDFDWFTDVVGPAQPVLDQVERTIERVAMRAPSLERKQAIQAEVKDIRTRMDEARSQAITLKELQSVPTPHADQRPAITLPELEAVLTTGSTAERFHPHPHIAGAYMLELPNGKVPITFRRTVLDEHAPTIRLLTYGTQELEELLREAGGVTSLVNGQFIVDGEPVSSIADLPRAPQKRR